MTTWGYLITLNVMDAATDSHTMLAESRTPVIWLANDSGHPGFERAKDAIKCPNAEIRRLTLNDINYMAFDRLKSHLARGIGRYVHPDDYLVLSGAIVINVLAVTLWLQQFRICKLLVWHGGKKRYETLILTDEYLGEALSRAIMGVA